ncbi:MAG: glycosyltransferase [Peptococcaceae bacterium]|nr:glycosyltransferase [Peptococcaceae bacterium]
MPTLSIILPAYNAEQYLDRCVRSVLSQSCQDWELIIVDDGSTDATADICNGFASEDTRIQIVRQPNAGVSAARNAGMRIATGRYTAFLDADDTLDPEAYTEMLAAMAKHGADCCVCGYYKLFPKGEPIAVLGEIPPGHYSAKMAQKMVVLPLLADRLRAGALLGTIWRYLFNTKTLADRGLSFTGAYLEDEIFLIEYFSLPLNLASVDKPLYTYYQNPNSVTRRYLEGFMDTFLVTLRRKIKLVEAFSIPVPEGWIDNSAWAGLLIAVSNEFAPGHTRSFREKVSAIKKICREPVFEHALKHYTPSGMARAKAVVAALLRRRLYYTLALLYTFKNRNRA